MSKPWLNANRKLATYFDHRQTKLSLLNSVSLFLFSIREKKGEPIAGREVANLRHEITYDDDDDDNDDDDSRGRYIT